MRASSPLKIPQPHRRKHIRMFQVALGERIERIQVEMRLLMDREKIRPEATASGLNALYDSCPLGDQQSGYGPDQLIQQNIGGCQQIRAAQIRQRQHNHKP